MSKKYDDEFLLNELKRFYNETGKVPIKYDFDHNTMFPSSITYSNHFGSWNNGLQLAGFDVNHIKLKSTGNEYCEICGSKNTLQWYYTNNLRICNKCSRGSRNYLHGILDPSCTSGIGVITEHVVYEILGDCKKCNTKDHFLSPYDLISDKYGTINVKSSKLYKDGRWGFCKPKNQTIPNYYICIGFDENKVEIQHVWIIPSDSKLIIKNGICITNSTKCLEKFKQYELNPEPYDNVYQNLDITTLPEFVNVVI